MDRISKFNLARRYEKRALLTAINCVAALSIFFFGYDQGVMGGVNTNRDYVRLMAFGHWDPETRLVKVDDTLLQGGIVSPHFSPYIACLTFSGGCVLFTRYSGWRSTRRLAWG